MLVMESIDRAYALCRNTRRRLEHSSEASKAMIGIYQLWVHANFRQQGIATRLVTAAREKMVFGLVVPTHQVALSSPTEAGVAFARRYMKGEDVFVYDCGGQESKSAEAL
jgi:GNAT superfamily N-acetyltransferase